MYYISQRLPLETKNAQKRKKIEDSFFLNPFLCSNVEAAYASSTSLIHYQSNTDELNDPKWKKI